MEQEAAVAQVLADYYRAFSTLEITAILGYFNEPFLFIGPAGVFSLPTTDAMVGAFAPVMEELRGRGYSRSELEIGDLSLLGPASALVTGVALRYRQDGGELERVGITYVLHRTGDEWKIAVIVFHG